MKAYISPYARCQSTVMPQSTGTGNAIAEGSFSWKLYPNPTTGRFVVEQTGNRTAEKFSVEIYTVTGEKIQQTVVANEGRHEFWLDATQQGFYFVKVQAEKTVSTYKLVLTR